MAEKGRRKQLSNNISWYLPVHYLGQVPWSRS